SLIVPLNKEAAVLDRLILALDAITKVFAIEYAALFGIINPGLAALGAPIPLGGTSNHFRGIR
ncbi:MAG TPA: hypothetical protein VKS78_03510, partial [Roseiarcus sp.]|nr:hypothetical protein [Roseiarcus sp.]